jgi:hypothetical protein
MVVVHLAGVHQLQAEDVVEDERDAAVWQDGIRPHREQGIDWIISAWF